MHLLRLHLSSGNNTVSLFSPEGESMLWVCRIFFIQSSVDRRLSCLHNLPVVSSAAINIDGQGSLQKGDLESFRENPRSTPHAISPSELGQGSAVGLFHSLSTVVDQWLFSGCWHDREHLGWLDPHWQWGQLEVWA